MACYRPITAWQPEDGSQIAFREVKNARQITLPCGRCIGCRQTRQRSHALRCMHESQMHRDNCFITLTFNDEHYNPSLEYRDFQQFMYRLREAEKPNRIRFFAAGEYGTHSLRPHWHALLFNKAFTDLKPIGTKLWRSAQLEKLWPKGYSSVGELNYTTALYVAKYTCKKVTGELAQRHYERINLATGEIVQVQPEQAHMSLKPGIGYTWFQKYWRELYETRDGAVLPGGHTVPPPRYYNKQLDLTSPEVAEQKQYDRYVKAGQYLADTTPERLAAREKVAHANQQRQHREKL